MSRNSAIIRSVATFTLDTGKCPSWLFKRMVRLARVITIAIIEEFGTEEFLRRLSDPVWFQSFGTLLAFDWNASGLTTTTLGALKVAIKGLEKDLNIFVCGGKGRSSRKTPDEILFWSDKLGLSQQAYENLVKASKLSAKVDNTLVQDGFVLYHHNFIFDRQGNWVVIQQGMNTLLSKARRYHWFSKSVKNFVELPHSGIQSQITLDQVFNLVLPEARKNKKGLLELVKEKRAFFYEIKRIQNLKTGYQFNLLELSKQDFSSHPIEFEDFSLKEKFLPAFLKEAFSDSRVLKAIERAVSKEPKSFESLVLTHGIGPKTIRALSLTAELIFGAKPSYEDPVRYSYTFGGKDGVPYPVERKEYDKIIEVLERAIKKSRLGFSEKKQAIGKIERLF